MRKIAILVPNFSKMDGGARTAELQAEQLAKEGNYVAVFALGADLKADGADLFVLGMPKSLFWERVYRLIFPLDIFKTAKWLPKLKGFDEAIVHLYPLTWLACLAKKFYGVKYTFWYHGIADPRFFPHLYEKVYIWLHILGVKFTVRNVDRAVAVSKYGRKELKRYTGLDSEVVYNELELGRFRPDIDGQKIREKYNLGDAPLILSVGAVRPVKGVHELVEAFHLVKKEIPEARLVIVGRHDYDYYSEQLRQSAGDGVIFTGFVPDEELPYYYGASDIYATCSHWEIHNRPVLEAQACGKPVVAFAIEPFQEEVDSNGLLVETGNVSKLAQACIEKIKQVRSNERQAVVRK